MCPLDASATPFCSPCPIQHVIWRVHSTCRWSASVARDFWTCIACLWHAPVSRTWYSLHAPVIRVRCTCQFMTPDTHFTHENVQHRLRVPRGRAGSKRPLSLLQFALSIPTTLFAWSLSHSMRVIRFCSAHPLLASLTRFQCTYPVILSIWCVPFTCRLFE